MRKFTSINTLFGRITSLRTVIKVQIRNPHVQKSTLRFLCAVRLVLHPQYCIDKSKLEWISVGYSNE